MATARDPHAVLGLEPGASQAEIKRAYRRLAKVLHPDFAGEQSLPAFLAVQEAYERLTGTRVRTIRPQGSGPASAPSGARGSSGFREPWRADPDRARAAREQARARRAGAAAGDGRQPGSGPRASGGGAEGSTRRPGASAERSGTRNPPGGPRSWASEGHQTGDAAGPSADSTRGRGGTHGTGTRRRYSYRKATMGSTSYDEARDASDPRWAGASWYGPTSGEYWIVNPREYADPRKHGPGYSSRVRSGSAHGEGPEPEPAVDTEAAGDPQPVGTPAPGPPSPEAAPSTATPASRAAPARRAQPGSQPPNAQDAALLGFDIDRLLRSGTSDPLRRIGLVLLAWAPLGIAAAGLIGDITGCATYSTACDGTDPFLPWVAQAIILGVLLVIAPLTRILAVGAIATVLGLVPATGLVIAMGGARSSLAASVLAGALALAWLVGVGWAVRRMLGARGGEPS